MANKWRGEVEFPALGEGAFVSFPLEDLVELETRFGDDFFSVIEQRIGALSVLIACMSIGLKSRDAEGKVTRIWDDAGRAGFDDGKFDIVDMGKTILNAIALSYMHKSYDELVADALARQKEHDAANLKRAKEAAEEAGIPFNEALSDGLSKLLIALGSVPTPSGN